MRKIADKDLNKLIERAYYLANKEYIHADTHEYDYDALKKIAVEMGIPEDKLQEAYHQIVADREAAEALAARKAARRKQIIYLAVIMAGVVLVCVWMLRPRTFSGTVETAIATSLDGTSYMPLDAVDTITTTQGAFFAHALIKGNYGEAVEWELLPPDGGAPVIADKIIYANNQNGSVAYQLFSFAPTMPLGEWKAVLKIFNKPVAERKFIFAKGIYKTQITFTKQVDSNYKPVQSLSGFKALTDTMAICHVVFRDITPGQNFKVVWEYYDPDGKPAYSNSLDMKPNAALYNVYSPMMIDYRSIKTGKWTVKLLVNGDLVNQRSFDIDIGDADVVMTTGMKDDKPADRTSVFKSSSPVYGYVFWPKINQRKIVLTWKVKDSEGNLVRSIDQALSNKGGTDWWAYRQLIEPNSAAAGKYAMELWGGNLLIAERNFEIVK
ncbi:hypothetical protein [Rhodoflexus sp.]